MFEPIKPKEESEKSDVMEQQLAIVLSELVPLLKTITEFKQSDLKAISLLQTDKYMKQMLEFYIANLKHIDRKHASEILQAFESTLKSYSQKVEILPGMGIGQQGFNQPKRGWFGR